MSRDASQHHLKKAQDAVQLLQNELAETNTGLVSLTLELERVNAELKSSNETFGALLEAAPDGVVVSDTNGEITLVNAQTEKMFAYSREDLLGQPIEVLIPKVRREKHIEHRQRFVENPTTRSMGAKLELLGRRADGTDFPVQISLSPVRISRSSFVMAIVRDMSERKELTDKALRLQALLDVSEDAVMGGDVDGIITTWSLGAQKVYGYTAAEMEGRLPVELLPPDLREELSDLHAQVRRGETVRQHSTRRIRKDGREIWVSLSMYPVTGEDGAVEGFSITGRDITESRQLQQQLLQAQKMEAVGQLTGGIAHDFNNLLTVVALNLQTLSRRMESDDGRLDLIQTASRALDRGAALTRQLLAFAKRQPLDPEVVDVNERLAEMETLLRRTLGERITLDTNLAEDLWSIRVDVAQLESSLLNLALNARDAMPEGGQLTVETVNVKLDKEYVNRHVYASPGPYVMIAVSDSGIGISEDALERVFDPFFTSKAKGKGSGLGLSMVYGFIKQSGGYINIYSEVGRGTTVKLYLPKSGGEPRPAAEQLSENLPCGDETILVVDDNPDVRGAVAMLLRDIGYTVLEAHDSESALQIIENESNIALLFTDIVMPGEMDGLKLAEKARTLKPELKVLYTSGYTEHAIDPERFKKVTV